jgi:hypothetical protein
MRYAVYNHQDKADAFIDALQQQHEGVMVTHWQDTLPQVDFVLTDCDIRGRVSRLERFWNSGARWFFVYPHAARPNVANDIHPAWQHTTAHFVVSEAHAEVMRAYGYDRPTIEVGWSLCPLRPFQGAGQVRKVLFAPIHPRCAEVDKEVNRQAFRLLRVLAELDEIELTVRYLGMLEGAGLEVVDHENIRYTRGEQEPGWEQIDQADVVVAHQTFLYLAVARGVPAVGIGTRLAAHLVPGNDVIYAPNWDAYVDLLAYPLDLAEADDPMGMLEQAAAGDRAVDVWRERMIGESFDAERFLSQVNNYLGI